MKLARDTFLGQKSTQVKVVTTAARCRVAVRVLLHNDGSEKNLFVLRLVQPSDSTLLHSVARYENAYQGIPYSYPPAAHADAT